MRKTLVNLILLLLAIFATPVLAGETALDRYIAKPDPYFAYNHYKTDDDHIYKTYFLTMTSQQWRSTAEVDRALWEHDIEITIPEVVHSDSSHTAILLVNGGSNNNTHPTKTDDVMAAIAVYLGSVIINVRQIPNQPLNFSDEVDNPRSEDSVLAYSFDKYLKTRDEEWPVLLPMTKAVVRAMDVVQEFLEFKGEKRIDDFIVVGGSKRGWTTWLTAAVDPRIKAIAPASIDLLNLDEQFTHHYETLGFYAPAIAEYVDFDLPCRIAETGASDLLDIIDPYSYLDRMSMPKFVANSAGDQFFLPDSSRFYWKDVPEPKRLRYSPNTDHLQSEDVIVTLLGWIDDINDGKSPPRYSWTVEPDGTIQVVAESKPDKVRLWQATNPNARDFRLEEIGPAWTSTTLSDTGGGVYRGYAPPPPQGWTAYLVELTFETAGELSPDETYSTEAVITPDTLPFEGRGCDDCRDGLCLPSQAGWRAALPLLH